MAGHTSVLPGETLRFLDPAPGETIIDGTLGCGGHAGLILERLLPSGRLIGFDKDPQALVEAASSLAKYGEKAMLIHDDFKNVPARLRALGIGRADGFLLDLGVSSPQLDVPARGFSFSADGPLDMRMDPSSPLTAREIVNRRDERELAELIWTLGEERFSRRIARRIVERRAARPFARTAELAAEVAAAVPGAYRHGRIHPATRTFQALRIAVNGELESLEGFLRHAPEAFAPGARVVAISFHSLEDRLVKRAFREWQRTGLGEVLTKKPVEASDAEIASNPRARSAKLRAFRAEGGKK